MILFHMLDTFYQSSFFPQVQLYYYKCFCASLLRAQIQTPRHVSIRALSNKVRNLGQMAIAMTLPGFKVAEHNF